MRFGTSDTNEATFYTHVYSYAVMNVGNLKLHQCIITTNPDIVESHTERTLLFNEMWAKKSHTKKNKIKDSNSHIPHGTVNNPNISHLKQNQDLTYY